MSKNPWCCCLAMVPILANMLVKAAQTLQLSVKAPLPTEYLLPGPEEGSFTSCGHVVKGCEGVELEGTVYNERFPHSTGMTQGLQ